MSLNTSPEIEARIAANAEDAGLSIDAYLEQVVEENETITALVRDANAGAQPLSHREARAKIERGLAQLERGDCVDGEEFMTQWLGELNGEHNPQAG